MTHRVIFFLYFCARHTVVSCFPVTWVISHQIKTKEQDKTRQTHFVCKQIFNRNDEIDNSVLTNEGNSRARGSEAKKNSSTSYIYSNETIIEQRLLFYCAR